MGSSGVAAHVVRMELAVRPAAHGVRVQEPGPHHDDHVARQAEKSGHQEADADDRFIHRALPSFAFKEQQGEVNAYRYRVEGDREKAEDRGGVVEAAGGGLGVEAVPQEAEGGDGLVSRGYEGREQHGPEVASSLDDESVADHVDEDDEEGDADDYGNVAGLAVASSRHDGDGGRVVLFHRSRRACRREDLHVGEHVARGAEGMRRHWAPAFRIPIVPGGDSLPL